MSDARFRITYRPEGADPRVWEVDLLDDLRASEMIALKKASGGSISGVAPLMQGVMELDGEALKGIVWLMLKRSMSTVPWDGLDFPFGAVQIDDASGMTPGRKRARLEELRRQGNLNAAGEQALAELVDAGVEAEGEAPDPKA